MDIECIQEPFHRDTFYIHSGAQNLNESLAGRNIGSDFEPLNGYRMYHGEKVPGFPVHPHRGFETITLVREGYVDHADSLGAAGRYGSGDVQWMTAGAGIQHSEMFPLLDQKGKNTLELMQIWINLPKKSKLTPAGYKMFWSEEIPRVIKNNGKIVVDVIAGEFEGQKPVSPPEASWAADPKNHVALWMIEMEPEQSLSIPSTNSGVNRVVYFYEGDRIDLSGNSIEGHQGVIVNPEEEFVLKSGTTKSKILILQGQPINEPVFQHGPFVMNTRDEIVEAIQEYQRTQFGGWPWDRDDMVHGDKKERFGRQADGSEERPKS